MASIEDIEFYIRSISPRFQPGKHDYVINYNDECKAFVTVTRCNGSCDLKINRIEALS